MKIVTISDTHTKHNNINLPEGDVLIHCGDFTYLGKNEEIENFNLWLQSISKNWKAMIVIAGNHDFGFERNPGVAQKILLDNLDNCFYLEDSGIEIGGVSFYGTPYQPEFFNWAFNLPRNGPQLLQKWQAVPSNIDVLITHSPPYGILDKCGSDMSRSVGCELLKNELERIRPKYHCFGHIHESYGYKVENEITFINCSILDEKYRIKNSPQIFSIVK